MSKARFISESCRLCKVDQGLSPCREHRCCQAARLSASPVHREVAFFTRQLIASLASGLFSWRGSPE